MSQLLGRVGPGVFGDGSNPAGRMTHTGAWATQQTGGKYRESVNRGNVFTATLPAAGVATGTALSTTAFLSLWNPAGSGRNLNVLRATLGYISGVLGPGVMVYGTHSVGGQASPTGGTNLTAVNNFLGAGLAKVGIANTGGTLAATPIIGEAMANLFPELTTTPNPSQIIVDDIDGRYMISPGCGLSLQFIGGAGTLPLLIASFTWEEINVGQE